MSYEAEMDQYSNCAPMSYTQNTIGVDINSRGGDYGGYGSSSYKSFLNFLNNSSHVIANLQPDQNGHVECQIDASKYSTLMILTFDENTVTQSTVDVSTAIEDLEKRDLSLSVPLNPDKYYNEMRNTVLLHQSDSHIIDDITSTEYLLVDSLEKVHQVQQEIRRMTGQIDINDFDFLKTWHTLNEEDKNKKYSKFMCHEVNLFLYFKDPDYFKTVIAPFIINKMEKTFVDHWLLGDHDEVCKYKEIEYFNRLNTLEKCLLITEVVKDSKEEAQALASSIKLVAEQYEPKIEVKNRIFDTVINLNMTQDKPTLDDSNLCATSPSNITEMMLAEENFGQERFRSIVDPSNRGAAMMRQAPMKKKMKKRVMTKMMTQLDDGEDR
jgi:hypothetical protein